MIEYIKDENGQEVLPFAIKVYKEDAYFCDEKEGGYYQSNNIHQFINQPQYLSINFFKSYYLLLKELGPSNFNKLNFHIKVTLRSYNEHLKIKSNLITNFNYYKNPHDKNHYMNLRFNYDLLLELIKFYMTKVSNDEKNIYSLLQHFSQFMYEEITLIQKDDNYSNKSNYIVQIYDNNPQHLSDFEITQNEFYELIDDYELKSKLMYGSNYKEKLQDVIDLKNILTLTHGELKSIISHEVEKNNKLLIEQFSEILLNALNK